MKNKLLSSLIISGMVFASCSAFAATNFTAQPLTPTFTQVTQPVSTQYPVPTNNYLTQGYTPQTYMPPLQGSVALVPAGTSFPAVTTSVISSANKNAGDSVAVALGNDFYYNNTLIAPAGSMVNGTVIQVRKGGHAGKNGQIKIKFTNIMTPTGQMIPISGQVKTDDGTGLLYAGTAKDTGIEYAKDVGIGAAGGAVFGTALGALASGSVGRGAIYGTAVGAGAGLMKSLWDKGTDVEIPANARIDIVIDQPITVSK